MESRLLNISLLKSPIGCGYELSSLEEEKLELSEDLCLGLLTFIICVVSSAELEESEESASEFRRLGLIDVICIDDEARLD